MRLDYQILLKSHM